MGVIGPVEEHDKRCQPSARLAVYRMRAQAKRSCWQNLASWRGPKWLFLGSPLASRPGLRLGVAKTCRILLHSIHCKQGRGISAIITA